MIEKRKRRIIVERDFQYRFTLQLALVGGGLLLLYGGLLLFMVRHSYGQLIDTALLQFPAEVSRLRTEYRFLSGLLLGVIVLSLGFLFFLGLLLTHRIAGPLLALQNRFRDFAEGQRPIRLQLREGDEMQHLARIFNDSMVKHEDQEKLLKARLHEVYELAETKADKDVAAKLQELIKILPSRPSLQRSGRDGK